MAKRRRSTTGRGKVPPAPLARRSVEDWRTLDRKTRQHVNDRTGEILSDRQYRKRFLHEGKSNEQYAKLRGAPRTNYNRLVRARQDFLASHGIVANLQQVRTSTEMQQLTRELKGRRMKQLTAYERRKLSPAARKRYNAQYGPDSPLARALADLGYRDHDARHFVGDS